GIYNSNASPVLTNVCIANNIGAVGIGQAGGVLVATNTTLAGNAAGIIISSGGITAKNSLICGAVTGNLANFISNSSLLIVDNIAVANLFTDAANGDYSLKHNAIAVNAGNN